MFISSTPDTAFDNQSKASQEVCTAEQGTLSEPMNSDNGAIKLAAVSEDTVRSSSLDTTSLPKAPEPQIGLMVSAELEQALKECQEKVQSIARECRTKNTKFRDLEFDLDGDSYRCRFGLTTDDKTQPSDVRRVTEIFENPQFFKGDPNSNDIVQGSLGDCWFLSALSTLTTAPGLILCAARDEEIGVYGFVFLRDSCWVTVIIDDQLFCKTPKYEELKTEEQALYHDDKELYNSVTRKSGKGLLYAKSGTNGETWVSLFEKAYAKLHGDYASLAGGITSESLEDLCGGISVNTRISDILDTDKFWKEELMKVNDKSSLFAVAIFSLDSERSGKAVPTVQGLYPSHAYSVLRVKECRGKRFIVIRNPWGKIEWTGPWSDGSKEWNGEWIDVLRELEHELGDDGEFVMEYDDFLRTWQLVEQTRILDSSWIMSSHWISVPPPPMIHPWTHGTVTFHFTLPAPSPAILVLSQLDNRFFTHVAGTTHVANIDFCVYKRGDIDIMGTSYAPTVGARSVYCELNLEAGEYIVYPRVDLFQMEDRGYFEDGLKKWDKRKLSRVLTERTKSRTIASNYSIEPGKRLLPTTLSELLEAEPTTTKDTPLAECADGSDANTVITTTTTTTTTVVVREQKRTSGTDTNVNEGKNNSGLEKDIHNLHAPRMHLSSGDATGHGVILGGSADDDALKKTAAEKQKTLVLTGDDEDTTPVTLGLKVYTKRESVVVITGKLRQY